MKKHRTGSSETSPRFLPSPASSPAADDAGRVLSPLRRRSVSDAPRKLRPSALWLSSRRSVSDAPRKLRPSAPALWLSSRKPGILADHLGNDRLIDLVEHKAGDRPASATPAASPQSIIRQRSCSEFGRFDDKEEKEKGRRLGRLDDKEEKEKGRRLGRLDDRDEKEKGRGSKENCPIGGSMRYIGKIGFPRSPKPGSPPSPSSGATLTLTPGRISVDENALFLRRKSDFGLDYASSESDRSDTKIPTPRIPKSEAAKGGGGEDDRQGELDVGVRFCLDAVGPVSGAAIGVSSDGGGSGGKGGGDGEIVLEPSAAEPGEGEEGGKFYKHGAGSITLSKEIVFWVYRRRRRVFFADVVVFFAFFAGRGFSECRRRGSDGGSGTPVPGHAQPSDPVEIRECEIGRR